MSRKQLRRSLEPTRILQVTRSAATRDIVGPSMRAMVRQEVTEAKAQLWSARRYRSFSLVESAVASGMESPFRCGCQLGNPCELGRWHQL